MLRAAWERVSQVACRRMQQHSLIPNLHTAALRHFLHANVLDMMVGQPLQEYFLLLVKFDDRALFTIEGETSSKTPSANHCALCSASIQ